MTINERIRVLRKDLGLNQKEFGARIGLKNKTISWMEQDGNTVIEQNRRIICDKFHVSMPWLETGKGNMYAQDATEDIFDSMREELNLSNIEEKILRGFFDLDEHSRKSVTDFIVNIGRTAADISSKSAQPPAVDPIKQEVANYEAELRAQQEAAPSASAPGNAKKA